MKKKHESDGPGLLSRSVFKILRVMKLMMVLICFVGLLSSFGKSYSQNTKLSVEFKSSTIESVLNYIESRTDYSFMYDNKKIDVSREVNISAKDKTVEAILDQLFDNGVSYKMIGKHIIITPKDEQSNIVIAVEQPRAISGRVTDSSGQALPGVTVAIKGKTTGTITDSNGNYALANVPADAILQFSFVGMKTMEILISGKTMIDVKMKEETIGIEEVVAVGYVTQKRENISSSVSTIKSNSLGDRPVASPAVLLQGAAAGVRVTLNGGYPGAGATIKIRETGSWTGGTTPLYVIDGIQRSSSDFATLNPNDIENISILKDAGAASIYGIQGANGVVVVTTKKGTGTDPTFEYSFNYSTQRPTVVPKMMNAYEEVLAQNKIYDIVGYSSNDQVYYTPDEIEYFKTHTYSKWDAAWNNPVMANHSLAMSGGMNNHTKYRVSFGYLDQTGATKNSYDKFNTLLSIDSEISKDLQFSAGVGLIWDKNTLPYFRGGSSTDPSLSAFITDAFIANRTIPAEIDGKPTAHWHTAYNATAILDGKAGNSTMKTLKVDPRISLTYKVPGIQGLSAKASFGYHGYYFNVKRFGTSYYMYYFKTAGNHNHIITDEIDTSKGINGAVKAATSTFGAYDEQLFMNYLNTYTYQGDLSINYERQFGKHNIQGFILYEQMGSKGFYTTAWSNGFPNRDYQEFDGSNADNNNQDVSGNTTALSGQASYLGRLDYNYDSKYILGFTLRADGSYIFPPNKRWGYFPSVSGAWNIAKESFFEPFRKYLDIAKFRASWGVTGSSNTSPWQWQESYNQGNSGQLIGGEIKQNVTLGGSINPNITWEHNYVMNLGLDLVTPKQLVSASIDFWHKKTTDILGSRNASIPSTVGASLPAVNYGEGSSKGIDIMLGHNNNIGDFKYSLQLNFGYSTNKYLKVDQAADIRPYQSVLNKPMNGAIWGLHCEGIIRTQEQLDEIMKEHGPNFTIFSQKPELGMLMYKDVRGIPGVDKPDGRIDYYDFDVLTWNGAPRITYGLNVSMAWKGLDLSAQFSGLARYKIYPGPGWDGQNYYTAPVYWNDMWTPENPNAAYPSAGFLQWTGRGMNNSYASDFWMKNGSYFRLSSLVIGYTIPNHVFNRIPTLKGLRLYCSGTNLFFITKSGMGDYYDPEQISWAGFPMVKTFTLGVSANF